MSGQSLYLVNTPHDYPCQALFAALPQRHLDAPCPLSPARLPLPLAHPMRCVVRKRSGGQLCQLCLSHHGECADTNSACYSPLSLLRKLGGGKLCLVQPTGAGKSLVILGARLLLCGIYLVEHPLLGLTIDQVASFWSARSSNYGAVAAFNMDNQASVCPAFLHKVIALMTSFVPATCVCVSLGTHLPGCLRIRPVFISLNALRALADQRSLLTCY